MKKFLNKHILCAASIFAIFIGLNSPSFAYCNSPCPNPCSPSRTVCEGRNCTTYCSTTSSVSYDTAYYSSPALSLRYSTPNVSFSISNEVYGYSRPNIIVSNGFRPVYHRVPPKPAHIIRHKPAQKPALNHKPVQPKRRH